MFHPLNTNSATFQEGYDCFYSKELVCRDGKYKFKPKHRFNSYNSTTPPNEIEDFTFTVLGQEILNKNTAKEILLLFLTRNEDKKEVIMRIPLYLDKKSNSITRNFITTKLTTSALNYTTKNTYINLPFVNVDTLAKINNTLQNNNLIYLGEYSDKRTDFETTMKVLNNTKTLEPYEIYHPKRSSFIVVHPNDIYKQLCAELIDNKGQTFVIPITYFTGNNLPQHKYKGSAFYFPTQLFNTQEMFVKNELKKRRLDSLLYNYEGRTVYYGLKKSYKHRDDISKEIRKTTNSDLYRITDGTYECIKFDIQKRHEKKQNYPIPFAILKDKKGVCFRLPIISRNDFDNYFLLQEEADIIIKQKSEEKRVLEESITKKYGKQYAKFLINQDKSNIERFFYLAEKYGKQNAKHIMEKSVTIGWSKSMCKEAWGEPTKINRSVGSWGVHEQWVYKYSHKASYLYFRDGVLTSIQN